MAVNLSPVFGVAGQLFDNNGNPLAGGKIYTYLAGTTTNAATFTSAAGNIAHSNPIVLDGAGRVPSGEIWLTDGIAYKFVVEDSASALIGTFDNLTGINSNFVNFTNRQELQTATAGQTVFNLTTMQYAPGTNNLTVFVDGVNQYGPGALYAYVETDSDTVTFVSGLHVGASVKFTTSQLNTSGGIDAEQVSYNPPFVDAVPTNVEAKLAQTVSVKDFGAVGDGVVDDTAAIHAAVNSLPDNGGEIVFPSGTYYITDSIKVKTGVTLSGVSMGKSIILVEDGVVAIERDTIENRSFRVIVRDMWIRGKTAANNATLVRFNDIDDSTMQNVYLYLGLTGVELSGSVGATRNLFFNVQVANVSYGYDFNGVTNSAKILGGRIIQHELYGVYIRSGTSSNNVVVDGVAIESTLTNAVGVFTNSPNTSIMNCRFEQYGANGIGYRFQSGSSGCYAFANYFSIGGGGVARSISDPSVHQILDVEYLRVRQVTAKAWVRFQVVATVVTILDSFNVSTVVRNSAGSFTINFTNALSSGNWCGVCNAELGSAEFAMLSSINAYAAGSAQIETVTPAGALADARNISFACYNSD